MKKRTVYQKKLLKLIIGGVIYTLMMVIGSLLMSLFAGTDFTYIPLCFMVVMLLVAIIYLYRFFIAPKKVPLLYARYMTLISWFLMLAVFSMLAYWNPIFYHFVGVGYGIGLIIDRIFSVIHKKEARKIVLAVIAMVYALILMIVFINPTSTGKDMIVVYALIPLTLVIVSFVDAMKLVFSGLRRQTLMQIIKKTYTIEILYGLFTLIVATSIMFMNFETCFNNFGDALWYCFAVVTTIGFGDFVATSFVGRILTVMLGIYGIIVVALITSIIVNFYNETAVRKPDEQIIETVKELEHDRQEIADDNEEDNKDIENHQNKEELQEKEPVKAKDNEEK